MAKKAFDVDSFLLVMARKKKQVETEDIAGWVECSVRYIQRYAAKNDVPYSRIHGIKRYIWSEEDVRNVSKWLNRKYGKVKKVSKTKKVKTPPPPPLPKIKKKVSFRTIGDLVDELYGIDDTPETRYKKRLFQTWAKKLGVPSEPHFGRTYYIIDDETRLKFRRLDEDKDFYYETFPEKERIPLRFRHIKKT
jgi:FMN phosphatase YigB (HAD superfamily)